MTSLEYQYNDGPRPPDRTRTYTAQCSKEGLPLVNQQQGDEASESSVRGGGACLWHLKASLSEVLSAIGILPSYVLCNHFIKTEYVSKEVSSLENEEAEVQSTPIQVQMNRIRDVQSQFSSIQLKITNGQVFYRLDSLDVQYFIGTIRLPNFPNLINGESAYTPHTLEDIQLHNKITPILDQPLQSITTEDWNVNDKIPLDTTYVTTNQETLDFNFNINSIKRTIFLDTSKDHHKTKIVQRQGYDNDFTITDPHTPREYASSMFIMADPAVTVVLAQHTVATAVVFVEKHSCTPYGQTNFMDKLTKWITHTATRMNQSASLHSERNPEKPIKFNDNAWRSSMEAFRRGEVVVRQTLARKLIIEHHYVNTEERPNDLHPRKLQTTTKSKTTTVIYFTSTGWNDETIGCKRQDNQGKVWILLVCCLAIHLEALPDNATESTVHGLKRSISRRKEDLKGEDELLATRPADVRYPRTCLPFPKESDITFDVIKQGVSGKLARRLLEGLGKAKEELWEQTATSYFQALKELKTNSAAQSTLEPKPRMIAIGGTSSISRTSDVHPRSVMIRCGCGNRHLERPVNQLIMLEDSGEGYSEGKLSTPELTTSVIPVVLPSEKMPTQDPSIHQSTSQPDTATTPIKINHVRPKKSTTAAATKPISRRATPKCTSPLLKSRKPPGGEDAKALLASGSNQNGRSRVYLHRHTNSRILSTEKGPELRKSPFSHYTRKGDHSASGVSRG